AIGGRRDRGGGHADDARAPAHPADHQLQHPGSLDHARRGAERRTRRKNAARDLQLVRLRRPERVAGACAGARLMADTDRKRALVTGGGRGLGSAIVRALAAAGNDVTFTYRSASAEADALIKEMQAGHPAQTFTAHRLDLADKAAVDAFANTLGGESFAIFVHNAGQSYDTLAVMMDQAKAEAAMQVNCWSFTRLVNTVVRPMMRAKYGR